MTRACVAVVALLLAACQPKKPASPLHIDPALEALVPADTVFVAGANVDAIRETPVYQKLLSRVPLPQLDAFARQTGLDPRKDLSQILSCSNGKQGLFAARGVFHVQQLEQHLEQNGAKRISYKNHNLFGEERAAILFLSPSTAVAGPAAQLRAILDQGGRLGNGFPPALQDLIRQVPADDQIWAVLSGGIEGLNLQAPENSNLANILQVVRSIDNGILGMDLRNGIALLASVTCKTDRDAKFVHDMVKGVVGLGRLNTPENRPELLKLYDSIQVTQQQNRAEVKASIPADLADKFLDLWLKR